MPMKKQSAEYYIGYELYRDWSFDLDDERSYEEAIQSCSNEEQLAGWNAADDDERLDHMLGMQAFE